MTRDSDTRSTPLTPELALRHHAWVRSLAAALVREPALADDVAQETWMRAMSNPPPEGASWRAWLGGIARRVASDARVSDGRRRRREGESARPEAMDSVTDLIGRVEEERALVERVLQLDEPYRATILRRFFDDWSVDQIARASDVPQSTVRTRLRRGLALLRERVEGERGADSRRWLSAIASAPAAGLGLSSAPAAPLALSAPALTFLPALAVKIFAVVLTAALLVVLVLSRAADPTLESPERETGVERLLARDSSALAMEEGTESTLLVPEPRPDESLRTRIEGTAESATAPREQEGGEVALFAGTIVRLNEDGSRSERLSGVLHAAVLANSGGTSVEIDVVDGAFELLVRVDEEGKVLHAESRREYPGGIDELRCECKSFEVEGLGAMLFGDAERGQPLADNPSYPALSTGVPLAVLPAPIVTLHVRDAASGMPLTGVEVRASTRMQHSRMAHPRGSRSETLIEGATSPVSLRPNASTAGRRGVTLIVRAERYGWKALTVDFLNSTERTLELSPGGDLALTFAGEVPDKAALRLRDPALPGLLCDVSLRGASEVHLDSLSPGTYDARVELGPWYSAPIVLGSETVDVRPGQTTMRTIDVEPVGQVTIASFEGVFVLPVEWGGDRPKLVVQRMTPSKTGANEWAMIRDGELDELEDSPGHYRFERHDLEVGRYELSYHRFSSKLVFDLPAEGRSDLYFEVPPPVEIAVHVVDAETGLAATDVESISWHVTWPEGANFGTSQTAEVDQATGVCQLRVPRDSIDVSANGASWGRLTIPLATDGLQVQLDVQRRTSASIVLRSGAQSIPWPNGAGWNVSALDGEGHFSASGTNGGEPWFGVTEPGRYRIAIPSIDGFEDHEPVEVELTAGKRTRVEVELVPKQ
ncbi:MAG: RNA polymerase sigma factor [Planctomycetota bacterium]